MAQKLDTIEGIIVTADTVEEAADFVVRELQGLTVARGARGFTVPNLTRESFELIEDKWARVFEFSAEFLPGGA